MYNALLHSESVEIAPGVRGVLFDDEIDGALVINYIEAKVAGRGDVARYLDALPTDRTVRVIAVTSERLAGMLERRGYKLRPVLMPSAQGWCPAYVRRAS